ncbi:hypothetical protein K470DRAFT_213737 [Piedraia hortae CBS 480.64]|uniref:C2H2-type domain-containing protein n=1 Tax=Piedraia hortae CBS 480.64 TaxID=1314780 RepID=A0A6A7C3P6_9PEZI|nr:hypothetical protein K470DRAFT_213737 [Piedraia hortae CBS 480.64]
MPVNQYISGRMPLPPHNSPPRPKPTRQIFHRCPQCGKESKNRSEAQKHELQHMKPFKCDEPDCSRTSGFATRNDLERHRFSVHRLRPLAGPLNGFICAACPPNVGHQPKFWPRRDNFKAHIRRKHPNMGMEDILVK